MQQSQYYQSALQVHLQPAATITFVPHAKHDLLEYSCLSHFTQQVTQQGYYGGIRLLMVCKLDYILVDNSFLCCTPLTLLLALQAMTKRFAEHCQQHMISLSAHGFAMRYETNIPRQAGLSGSSAIACAALNCLMQYYSIADRYRWPNLRSCKWINKSPQLSGKSCNMNARLIRATAG